MSITSNGILKINGSGTYQTMVQAGVASWHVSGNTQGYSALSFDIAVPDDSGQGCGHHVEANFTHINFGSYGCLLDAIYSSRAAVIQETYTIFNVSSGNGGSWSVSKPTASTLRVSKNAGSYAGGGYYWIKVTTYSTV
jgi:hypothetical protein